MCCHTRHIAQVHGDMGRGEVNECRNGVQLDGEKALKGKGDMAYQRGQKGDIGWERAEYLFCKGRERKGYVMPEKASFQNYCSPWHDQKGQSRCVGENLAR